MRNFSRLFSLVLLPGVLLVGCVSAPSYTNLNQDELGSGKSHGEVDFVQFMADLEQIKKPALLVESENTMKTVSYLKAQRQANAYSPLAYSDFDPEYLLNVLKKTFNFFGVNVSEEQDAKDNSDSNLPKIEVDARIHLGALSFDTTTLDLILIGFDESGKRVATIRLQGRAIIQWPADTFSVKASINNAIQQLVVALEERSGQGPTSSST